MRPIIAIVGRPNVGKSSLFNRLVGQPIAIVDPTPGTTRDRILHSVRRDGVRFDLVDTGGIGVVDERKLESDVYQQVERAIATADRIIFLVDVRDGLLPLDHDIAANLRKIHDRVDLVVNKVDHDGLESDAFQFLKLGLGEPHTISAAQATGLHSLLEHLAEKLPAMKDDGSPEEPDDGRIRLALVGRRNVGKSSLLNALARRDAAIVSETPGTTRDPIEVNLDLGGYAVTLIDTAGLRDTTDVVETEGIRRARAKALAADLRLGVIESADNAPDSRVSLELSAHDLVLINKCDLLPARHPPALYVSAKTGEGIEDLLAWLEQQVIARVGGSETMPMTRLRHRHALEEAHQALRRAVTAFKSETWHADLIAEDIRLAARALGRITGRVDVEDLLDVIFHDFCIGK